MVNTNPKTIYAIYCINTKRIYVGCCTDFKTRIKQHFSELAKGEKKTTVAKLTREKTDWQKDYDKYGRDAFEVYILEQNVPAELSGKKELEYILKYHADEPTYGYNLRPARGFEFVVKSGMPPVPHIYLSQKAI